jgi:hypothetical protein
MLNLGDKLKHIESGLEAEYITAIPTAVHGFIHLLKTADEYVYRLTGDLESQFSRPDTTSPLSQTDGSSAANEAKLLDALIARLRSEGVIPTAQPAAVPEPVKLDAADDDEPEAPAVPDASAHLPQTDAPTENENDPQPGPANSIAL